MSKSTGWRWDQRHLLPSLEAERSLLQTEDALAQSDSATRRDLIALYQALGGGWDASQLPSTQDVLH